MLGTLRIPITGDTNYLADIFLNKELWHVQPLNPMTQPEPHAPSEVAMHALVLPAELPQPRPGSCLRERVGTPGGGVPRQAWRLFPLLQIIPDVHGQPFG